MPNDQELIYWDACIFLAYVNGEAERLQVIDAILAEIENNDKQKIITSIISVVEVAHSASEKNLNTLNPEIEEKIDLLWEDRTIIEMVEFHLEIAQLARQFKRKALKEGFSLSVLDAIHLASAAWVGVKEFHTFDEKLYKFESLAGFRICAPYIQQPRLPNM